MSARVQFMANGRDVPKHKVRELIEDPTMGVIVLVHKGIYDLNGERYDFTNAQEMDTQGNFEFVCAYRIPVICHRVVHRYYLLVCYEMENAGDEQQ